MAEFFGDLDMLEVANGPPAGEDDEAGAAEPPGKKRRGGSKGQPVAVDATCQMPKCESLAKPKNRWCYLHERYSAQVIFSAGLYEEEGHPGFKEEFKKKMKKLEFAQAEIAEEEERNPPSINILKKTNKRPIDWAAKQEIWEKKNEKN